MGHPLLSMNPMLFVMSTLWVREHNRVCDLLVLGHPTWTDQQVFVTAKRIVTGEMMTIMLSDVINVHAGHSFSFKLKPELYHGRTRENDTLKNTPFELLLTSMWPSSLPDELDGVPLDTTLFGNNKYIFSRFFLPNFRSFSPRNIIPPRYCGVSARGPHKLSALNPQYSVNMSRLYYWFF